MNKLIRWYNSNRKVIFSVIIAIIFIIMIVNVLNEMSREKLKRKNEPHSAIKTEEIISNTINVKNDKSSISGQEITNEQKETLKTIDEFATYCNNKEVDKAYEVLSNDCKKELYSTKEIFEQNYYNKIFKGKERRIVVENWTGDIYKVKFKEDAMSTGKFEDISTIQDYITIINEDGKNKLNINGYVGKKTINKVGKNEDILIKVIESNQYMDYEEYAFEIVNNSNNTVYLKDKNLADTLYLEDKNGIKYQAYSHELTSPELKVGPKEKKSIKIKYYSKFSSNRELRRIVFKGIILNYEAYLNYQNKSQYNDYATIEIEL